MLSPTATRVTLEVRRVRAVVTPEERVALVEVTSAQIEGRDLVLTTRFEQECRLRQDATWEMKEVSRLKPRATIPLAVAGTVIGVGAMAYGSAVGDFDDPDPAAFLAGAGAGSFSLGVVALSGAREVWEPAHHFTEDRTRYLTEWSNCGEGAYVGYANVKVTGRGHLKHDGVWTDVGDVGFVDGVGTLRVSAVPSEVWRADKVHFAITPPSGVPASPVSVVIVGDREDAYRLARHEEQVAAVMAAREAERKRIADAAWRAREAENMKDPCYRFKKVAGRGSVESRIIAETFGAMQCAASQVGAVLSVVLSEEQKVELVQESDRLQGEFLRTLPHALGASASSFATSAEPARVRSAPRNTPSAPPTIAGTPPTGFAYGAVFWPDGSPAVSCPVSGATAGGGVTERVYTDSNGFFYLPLSARTLEEVYLDGMRTWSGALDCRRGCELNLHRR